MGKTRVSLTVEEKLIQRIDAEAEHRSLNRSQMVEYIIQNYVHNQGVDTAVIFCGDPERSPLREWGDKPVLASVLEAISSQVDRAILLAGENAGEIKSHFGDNFRGLKLEYVSDEGSGPASALKELEDRIGKTFVALNGDIVTDIEFDDMLEVHRDEDSVATMALRTADNPSNYGVVRMKGRTVLGFEEKPEPGEEPTRLVNEGIYIFEPEVFDLIEDNSLQELFEELSDQKKLSGYIYGGKWKKID